MRRWWTVMGVALAVLLAPATPALAANRTAASTPEITTYTAMTGVPGHVPAGGTLSFTMTFSQQSSYSLYLDGLAFEVWNRCLCPPDDSAGTTATFLDPTTGSWRTTPGASGDSYGLFFQQQRLVPPGHTVSVPVRLALGHFRSGSCALADNGTQVGTALDGHGNPTTTFNWKNNEAGNLYFTIGTTTTPARSPTRASVTQQSRTTTGSRTTGTTVTASGKPSASPAPALETATAATVAPTGASPDSPAPALVQAGQASRAPAAWLWWLLLPVLLAGTGGIYAVRRQRARHTTTPASGAGDTLA